jgi:uncharacterized membrane protein YbhN (UPF0104 family)
MTEIDRNIEDTLSDDAEEKQELSPGRKFSSLAVRLTVSVALIILIMRVVDLRAFTETLISPKIWPLLLMIAFSLFFVFLGGLKLWVLFRGFSPINPGLFTGYYFLAGSIGSLAPAIFGDVTLIGLAKQNRIPFHKSISAILMDRCITLAVALFIFTPFTLTIILPFDIKNVFLLSTAALILTAGLVWTWICFAPRLFGRFTIMKKFMESFSLFFGEYRSGLYINLLISCARAVVSGITLILALAAADLRPPFWETVCISNSLSVLTHIPVSLSGLGLFEGSGLILFEAIGLNKERVLAGLLYHRLYIIVWAALTFFLLTFFWTVKKSGKG